MKSKWLVYTKKADFKAIAKKYNIDQVIARVIRNRDVCSDEDINMYLNGTIEDMHNPCMLKDAQKAAHIIEDKIKQKKSIRIIGDYDIDGICSIFILYNALRKAGADVSYVVPDRITDGYGINEHLIDNAIADGVDTIITCDNGIAAIEQVKYAKNNNITIIVTDHHDILYKDTDAGREYIVPDADAVVNPKQKDCAYPFDRLCGAGVAYKLVSIIYDELGLDKSDLEEYAEFMAIATVGDVVDLIDENRIIVKYGLSHIAHTRNIGLKALINECQIDIDKISSYHIGFIIGPCFNASGRLDTAAKAIELLLCRDDKEAVIKANELKKLNDERKSMTEEQVLKAVEMVETTELKNDDVLVVYLPDCHESIAGIIAGRLRERFYKPCFVITNSTDGAKGSGRSTEGYNMFEGLNGCAHLLSKYGGHPMAAGLSLPVENIDEFRREINEKNNIKQEDMIPRTWIDVPMPVDYVSKELIQQLQLIEPFGKGNEKPVFADRNLLVKTASLIGKNRNVLKMKLENERGHVVDAIMFNCDESDIPEKGNIISIVYYPDINVYNGNASLQFVIREYNLK